MRLCRYNDNRLGLVEGDRVADVTAALDAIPAASWPLPPGDLLIRHLDAVCTRAAEVAAGAERTAVADARLLSPVANPTKVIGIPVNYQLHIDEAMEDKGLSAGNRILKIEQAGPFLKACSALVGPSEGVALRFADRRNDHEVELAAIIGRTADRVPMAGALDHIAAYAIGLDMTVRGSEDRSVRKSIDSYAVLGPWLVTADEIADPDSLDLEIRVNGETRQKSNTRNMIFSVARLIEFCSAFYTLHPGDVIMTGTPEGVGPVEAGDVMHCTVEGIGAMDVPVRIA
ncbi:MAG: fumarylacetoacetate hydrolase family protein [Rhodospirillaceae bacterium]|nr:fumarylacetoacetate hydrolase family protein [Rhodospirillaceae bacterium]